MTEHISVGLVGVTGYTGIELLRLLSSHPVFDLVRATSRGEAGKELVDLFPFLRRTRYGSLRITPPDVDDLAKACNLVFLAVPHGTAMEIGAALVDRGVRVVDLSADFRLRNPEVYETWYKLPHTQTGVLRKAVFGLPELYADRIATAELIANPGCYPTSAILGLYPALKEGIIDPEGIVVDAKSGTSGAGRSAQVGSLFCEVADSFRAYNLGKHRHTPEIEQELSLALGREMTLSFNTHLLPIGRGILSTMYARLTGEFDAVSLQKLYEAFYEPHPWVRVHPQGTLPQTRWVRGTMFCDIGLVVDPRTKRLIVLSAIDNLCRGASGQALANANLMFGLDPDTGLDLPAIMP
ncbi:MAG: N-acetyl-gamma-glutamyl-phosphate reductase [Desulfovibrionales bacterium]